MQRQFKLVLFANVVFVLLFVFFNWAEYEMLNSSDEMMLQTHFPFYLEGLTFHSPMVTGFEVFILPNYLLLIFLLAITVNLYFLYKLQRASSTAKN